MKRCSQDVGFFSPFWRFSVFSRSEISKEGGIKAIGTRVFFSLLSLLLSPLASLWGEFYASYIRPCKQRFWHGSSANSEIFGRYVLANLSRYYVHLFRLFNEDFYIKITRACVLSGKSLHEHLNVIRYYPREPHSLLQKKSLIQTLRFGLRLSHDSRMRHTYFTPTTWRASSKINLQHPYGDIARV